MKAAVFDKYGPPDVLEIKDVPKPTPGDNEVLLRVRAASGNPLDWKLMGGKPYFIRLLGGRKPRITGVDVAGEVQEVGKKVTEFKVGNAVFGNCRGAFAEFVCTRESAVELKPKGVSFEQAAAVPVAGLTALQGLRDKARVRPGQKILINGAAGGVGTLAVQIARFLGADVTGVCSTRNLDLVRSLGAERVVDYSRENFTRSEERYDLIFDCVGNLSFSACRPVLRPGGLHLMVGAAREASAFLSLVIRGFALSRFASQRFGIMMARRRRSDLRILGELIESGKVTPVIDRRYPLAEAPAALQYLATGHARGKVVITVA